MSIKRMEPIVDPARREFLRKSFAGMGWLMAGTTLSQCADALVPLVQVVGHDLSEITGPAFDPSLQRLYFSSQRGDNGIDFFGMSGVTYEVTGPFFI